MSETIASIAKWHEETFPHATLLGQLEKFRDEKVEFIQAPQGTEDELFELADMFIVSCGVSRFDAYEGMYCFKTVATNLESSIFSTRDLARAVDEKMKTYQPHCIRCGWYGAKFKEAKK